MSAQNELPPGWSVHEVGNCAPEYVAASPRGRVAGLWITGDRDAAVADAWSGFGITREEYATMRAAVERCAELEAALEAALVMVRRAYEIGFGGTYGLDGSPYALAREIEKSGLLSDTPTGGEKAK